MSQTPSNVIPASSIIAVLTLDQIEAAVPLARALLAGGIEHIELTLRTPIALESIRHIASEVPQMKVGAGTLLTPQQVADAKYAGASFGVAPGTNPRVIAAARENDLPFCPGVCTPTDIELALESDCRILKFFPSEASGGLNYLKQIAAPYAHLGVKFIPLGGITPANASDYLKQSFIQAIGGSWLAPADLISQRDWTTITRISEQASQLRHKI